MKVKCQIPFSEKGCVTEIGQELTDTEQSDFPLRTLIQVEI